MYCTAFNAEIVVSDVCSGGKEWLECGTACPLTCDNYDNPPFACTLQCVQGCFCPAGKVDLNGVCVNSTTCKGNPRLTRKLCYCS